jgi:hypothetical protein
MVNVAILNVFLLRSLPEGHYSEDIFLGVVMLGAVRGSVIMLSVTVLSKIASRKNPSSLHCFPDPGTH